VALREKRKESEVAESDWRSLCDCHVDSKQRQKGDEVSEGVAEEVDHERER